MRRLALIVAVATSVGLPACKSQTAIVVTVNTEGINIPDMMDHLQILVSSGDHAGLQKSMLSGDLAVMSGPYSVTILRTDESVKSVLVKVRGLNGSKNIGESDEVQIHFKEGKVVRQSVNLNVITGCQDNDGDEFFIGLGCQPDIPTDCDDEDEFAYPGAPERCNGKDDNCDEFGTVDEGADRSRSGCPPRLGVCENVPIECVEGQWDCGSPPGYSEVEICDDELDNNCDGQVNERCACDDNQLGTECGSDLGECTKGTWQCIDDVMECVGGQGPTDDICDYLDNNCDGYTDEDYNVGDTCVVGLGICQRTGTMQCQSEHPFGQECNATPGLPDVEHCNEPNTFDEDCDGFSNQDDVADCLIEQAWADSCMWFYYETIDIGTPETVVCDFTLRVRLRVQVKNPPLQAEPYWEVLQETYPQGWGGTSHIIEPLYRMFYLEINLADDGAGNYGDLTGAVYQALLRLHLQSGGLSFAYYDVPVEVIFCPVNSCTYGPAFECHNIPPDDPTQIGLSCSGVIVVN